ncbi:MAG: peptide deformylase [Euryarchaeota archaeon]|jgi:peptide deformylase|nr:peptide deformylase [Euryarchaeota archaeon]
MKLIKAPNSWLDKTVVPFDFNVHNAEDVEKEMSDIMLANEGVGLAANQVELDAQIFVISPTELKGYEDKKPFAIINPKITHVTEETILGEEGCLSFPFLYFKVKRPYGLIIECLDSKQKECTIELQGWNARIFGHEYDHLYGINYTDRVSKLKLNMAIKKRDKFLKRYKERVPNG